MCTYKRTNIIISIRPLQQPFYIIIKVFFTHHDGQINRSRSNDIKRTIYLSCHKVLSKISSKLLDQFRNDYGFIGNLLMIKIIDMVESI